NGRLVVDFTPNANHQADLFLVQLNDADGLSGRWTFNTGGLTPGQPTQLASVNTIANPDAVYDGSGFVDTPPDLTRITNWAIEGQWASTSPFDISFDNLLISTEASAPPPYAGFEADAPWRAEAATRIDAIRKADLTVRVVDAAGNPLPGATVAVTQQEHAFGFGSAVQSRLLGNNPQADATYQQNVANWFNVATVENNFKWPPWEGDWGPAFSRTTADRALDWLESQGIPHRGHAMVWPGLNNLPNSIRTLVAQVEANPSLAPQLRQAIADHIADIGGFGNGRMAAWDVINEPRANHDIMDVLPEGDDAMATWFQLARAADPNAKLFLNEFGILTSGGGTNTANQQLLKSQLQALLDAGAPVNGVGLQSHFNQGDLTGPEQLWQIVDRYADMGLDVQITEFDVDVADEELQAAYLRDFYTAMFAHEGVDDILMWGFWEGAIYMQNRAIFRQDWSAKPAGEAYLDLVFNEWWTDESAGADAAGEAIIRAFKGDHDVTAEFGGEQAGMSATLNEDGTLTITLAMLQGDYNRDGVVDAADYTAWRDARGTSVATAGLGADGNGDGTVDDADLAIWRANFGQRLAESTAIPEPTTLLLLLALLLAKGSSRAVH
ncbi:MAG: endo-1,4-beta-xylanase, partial [Planctomycetota bacterium]